MYESKASGWTPNAGVLSRGDGEAIPLALKVFETLLYFVE